MLTKEMITLGRGSVLSISSLGKNGPGALIFIWPVIPLDSVSFGSFDFCETQVSILRLSQGTTYGRMRENAVAGRVIRLRHDGY